MQSLRTSCPLLKQDKLIRNIQEAAKRHQQVRKNYVISMKTFNNEGVMRATGVKDSDKDPFKQTNVNNSVLKRKNTAQMTSSRFYKKDKHKCDRSHLKSQKSSNRPSRESGEDSKERVSSNPFKTGEALEQFERKMALK